MRNFHKTLALAATLLVAACATTPLPENYQGPIARVFDHAEMQTPARGAFYYVAEFNGQRVDNALSQTRLTNQGRGFSLTPVRAYSRLVPAGVATLKLEARNAYGAPIQELAMASSMRSATRIVNVELKAGVDYQVRGTLAEGGDDVWLEALPGRQKVGSIVR